MNVKGGLYAKPKQKSIPIPYETTLGERFEHNIVDFGRLLWTELVKDPLVFLKVSSVKHRLEQMSQAAAQYYLSNKYFPAQTEFNVTHREVPRGFRSFPDIDLPTPLWSNLSLSHIGRTHYKLTYLSGGEGLTAWFKIIAQGDLDGDGVHSNFEFHGTVSPDGFPVLSVLHSFDEDE